MQLDSKDVIDQPVDKVYSLVKDNLTELVPYLPNIDKIETTASKDLPGGKVQKVNQWYAKAEMPALLKKIAKPELFSWKDTAVWNDEELCVEYELESAVANDLYDAKGKNYFRDLGDGRMELNITCDVKIYPENLPGVPRILAKKVVPVVETLVEKILQPNLTSLAKGLKGYFKEH